MKTLILTGYDDIYAPLGDLTGPRMLAYASRHRYDFQCFRDCPSGIESSWHKLEMVLKGFMNYDRVLWVDADMMITNPAIAHNFTTGFHASLDWGFDATKPEHFSAGAFIVCHDASQMLAAAMCKHDEYVAKGIWEQQAMREQSVSSKVSTTHPRRVFNAIAPEVHESIHEPWQHGDWAVHFTMIPLRERVALFHRYERMGV